MTNIVLPEAFKDLFTPSRYKAFYGGRGSGKSHSMAQALVILAAQKPLRILCCREIQKSIKDSVKRLIDDKINAAGLKNFYDSTQTEIRGKNGSLFVFSGLRSNPESIKSMEGIDICWVEEASTVSRRSLDLLIPTIRKPDSEIWFTWNPNSEMDPVDVMFRCETPPPDSVIRMVNHSDNPFFPDVLAKEMQFDRQTDIEKYQHVWLGGYMKVQEGAYYAKQLATLASKGQIARVAHDPHAQVHAAFDLGISDYTSIWMVQSVGKELHVIDFIENNGQPITWYANEIKARGYNLAPLILPHDARARQLGTGKSIEEVLRSLGFDTRIAPSLSVKDGIEAVRRILTRCWFDDDKCQDGLRALREYRSNYDEKRRIDRGPLHDWTSHAADAFRYLALAMEEGTDKPSVDYNKALAMYMNS